MFLVFDYEVVEILTKFIFSMLQIKIEGEKKVFS